VAPKVSDAIRKIPILSDNCDDTGTILYNLDAIIAVGYRVNSYEATQFRIWAREVLKGSPSHCATLYSIVPELTLYSVCA